MKLWHLFKNTQNHQFLGLFLIKNIIFDISNNNHINHPYLHVRYWWCTHHLSKHHISRVTFSDKCPAKSAQLEKTAHIVFFCSINLIYHLLILTCSLLYMIQYMIYGIVWISPSHSDFHIWKSSDILLWERPNYTYIPKSSFDHTWMHISMCTNNHTYSLLSCGLIW